MLRDLALALGILALSTGAWAGVRPFPPGFETKMIETNGTSLYVRIGGDDSKWQPNFSNYRDYREYAQGAGWKVWVGLPGNPPFQEAPLKPPLPVPTYQKPETIDVPDSALN